ncbi:uncharacterized protein LOC108112379 isoform X2 [Drosophila eugracilis]|uniref:uncharacterized protein LOC108112379 isoform X2 n=1 Tax=Drosophila eugracilis TaxID=29029 RepID=UPI0007E6EA17|nr:uncharacterized protein LOC108112379 isoform X2 [Drosophila eugracilis]
MSCNNALYLSVSVGYISQRSSIQVSSLILTQMIFRFNIFFSVLLAVLLFHGCGGAFRKWDYEPISITSTTSDPSLLHFEPKLHRIGRGVFNISGVLFWNYDTTEETMIEAIVYRSTFGEESDYKLLPWAAPKQTFYDYMNTFYKDVIIKSIGKCSDAPQFEGKFEPPFPKKTYTAQNCEIEGEGLPDMAPPGFYKVIFNCFGPDQPSWSIIIVVKITTKMF